MPASSAPTAIAVRIAQRAARLLTLLVVSVAGGAAGWAKGPDRPITIPLEQLGQQPQGGRPLIAGSTVATVHFVDARHLLVTFPVRRLMKRLADCPPDDEDRLVDAVLVDLPSGAVAARTTWRFHDSGQYLWDLGHGRFLLRVRDRLTTLSLAGRSGDGAFAEQPLLDLKRRILGIVVSAEGDLLTVESVARPVMRIGDDPEEVARRPVGPVEINFYRLNHDRVGGAGSGEVLLAEAAGRIVSRATVELPVNREGYLDISQESKGTWLFDYLAHGGKKTELAPYDTSCQPRAKFVSRSEFVAFGCRGAVDRVILGGFDMRGDQMWQQNFTESFTHPTFSFAPESGRFAMGRAMTAVATGMMAAGPLVNGDELTSEDVQVIQMHSGRQLLRLSLTPVQSGGQNFSLAPDGMALAVIRSGRVEVYRLPELSVKDEKDVKEARQVAFEPYEKAIMLPTRTRSITVADVADAESASAGSDAPDAGAQLPAGLKAAKTAAPGTANAAAAPAHRVEVPIYVGDAPPADGPRKPPTLYAPGETGSERVNQGDGRSQ